MGMLGIYNKCTCKPGGKKTKKLGSFIVPRDSEGAAGECRAGHTAGFFKVRINHPKNVRLSGFNVTICGEFCVMKNGD